ncbi:MAG: rhodanese-like domain-containing protein [Acetobacteraceae bacterium]|nr:rhodanese-like domain-containing protein [Acetobacteraceae bacterium]
MAGVPDVAPRAAWEALRDDPQAALVDVRTEAEWTYVGLPDLSATGKQPVLVQWQLYPSMQLNGQFVEQLRKAGLTPLHRLYFICRSGARSLAAAQAAQAAGFPHAFNVADGFEGPVDEEGHRGTRGGWKAEGLPWRQR